MKKIRERLSPVVSCLLMILIILDSKTALSGAQAGIDLCIKVLIPTLFPLMVLGNLLTGSLSGIKLSQEWGLFLLGLLGGYPLGAQLIGQACRRGELDCAEARRLSAFCSQPGPAFILGMSAPLFASPAVPWALWGVVIVSSMVTRQFFPAIGAAGPPAQARDTTLTQALGQSLRALAMICGWVVLFRVFLALSQHWLLAGLPETAQILVWGFLELTNGCRALATVSAPGARFLLCALFLSCGGICVWLQTDSVLQPLGTGHYALGKIIQTLVSFFLAWLTQPLLFSPEDRIHLPAMLPLVLGIALLWFWKKRKITVAIPASTVYNEENIPAR